MERKPCEVCGETDGPSIYASDETCSVACQKFLSGQFTVVQWEAATQKNFYETAKSLARKLVQD